MSEAHDRPSATPDRPSGNPGGTDPLSDVLRTVRLTGAQFFLVEASSPWCVDIPAARSFADVILPGAQQIISYHVVVEGRGLARVPGSDDVTLEAGDIVVFPHGDPYVMRSGPGVPPELDSEETMVFFHELAAGRLPFVVPEGGGNPPPAKFICGFLGCDLAPFNPLLSTLPRLLHVRRAATGRNGLLDRLIALTLEEAQRDRAGGKSIRLGLSELLFVEVLRRHLAELPADAGGWLAGLSDGAVARALALIHGDPCRNWNLVDLARQSGASRTVLAERFGATVGQTPMRYLTLWRMQLASRMLIDGSQKIAAVAEEVGYGSEASFSRAFKKATGQSPAAWRTSGGLSSPP